jgi:hypothetical protein
MHLGGMGHPDARGGGGLAGGWGGEPYQSVRLEDLHGPKPYKLIRSGNFHGPEPYII